MLYRTKAKLAKNQASVIFLFISSAFVPTELMPSGIRAFAENQPVGRGNPSADKLLFLVGFDPPRLHKCKKSTFRSAFLSYVATNEYLSWQRRE